MFPTTVVLPSFAMTLATALMNAFENIELPKWEEGRLIQLWEGAWTFSYHFGNDVENERIHYRETLKTYWSGEQAREARANFVQSLNMGWVEAASDDPNIR